MAKVIKKKFYAIDIPMFNEEVEAYSETIESLDKKTMKLDVTRKLKGKSVEAIFQIKVKDGKAAAYPKKITVLPFFIRHIMHKGVSYVEDSFEAQTSESEVIIKPFLITRKKVSRAVKKTLRNSAKNWILDYLKTKTDDEVFSEILSGQIQRPLSTKLKKVYPLAVCEIRIFEIKNPLSSKPESPKEIDEIKIKEEIKENAETKEIKEEISEKIEPSDEKPKKARKSKKSEAEKKAD